MSSSSSSVSQRACKRGHRTRARSVVESESSDESVIVPRRRKMRRQDPSPSSDSGSSVEVRKSRRRGSNTKFVVSTETESEATSSGGGEGHLCPICLGNLHETSLHGRPDSCEHTFCVSCITAWGKTNTTCALCRKPFSSIRIILGDDLLEEIPVQPIIPDDNPYQQYYDMIACLRCFRPDQEESLLLCDNCNDAYHCACLEPPLSFVPVGAWYCPRCSEREMDRVLVGDVAGSGHSD